MKAMILVLFVLLLISGSRAIAQAPAGKGIDDAIPLAFNQTYSDLGDARGRPNWVFAVVVPKGIEVTASLDTAIPGYVRLLAPESRSFQNYKQLAVEGANSGRRTVSYVSPVDETYYIWVEFQYYSNTPSTASFEVVARPRGIPIATPPLVLRNCVTGVVQSITYSTLFLPYGRADEIVIGDTRICLDCDLKPPLLAALDVKLGNAYTAGTQVEACFTEKDGILARLKFFR